MKINKISVFISIELHYLQNWNQKVTFDRFWKNLNYAWINSSFDESLLRMASSSYNQRLLNLSLYKKLSYLLGWLITIHHRQVAIPLILARSCIYFYFNSHPLRLFLLLLIHSLPYCKHFICLFFLHILRLFLLLVYWSLHHLLLKSFSYNFNIYYYLIIWFILNFFPTFNVKYCWILNYC